MVTALRTALKITVAIAIVVRIFAQEPDRDAQTNLEGSLRSPSTVIRKSASEQIGRLGPSGAWAIPIILERLADATRENYEVRASLVTSLGQIGVVNPAVIDAIENTTKDRFANVRLASLVSLGTLLKNAPSGTTSERLIELMLPACSDSTDIIRTSTSAIASDLSRDQIVIFGRVVNRKKDPAIAQCAAKMARTMKIFDSTVDLVGQLSTWSESAVRDEALKSLTQMTDRCIEPQSPCADVLPHFESAVRLGQTVQREGGRRREFGILARNVEYLILKRDHRDFSGWQKFVVNNLAEVAIVISCAACFALLFCFSLYRRVANGRTELAEANLAHIQQIERLKEAFKKERDEAVQEVLSATEKTLASSQKHNSQQLATLTQQLLTERKHYQTLQEERSLAAEVVAARDALAQFAPKPTPLERRDIRIASAFSEASSVSGDFFNWSIRHDGAACVYLVDVEGHGFEAASHAILSATILSRTVLGEANLTPREALDSADRLIRSELGESRISFTMCLARISPDRKLLELANAGMPPALLFRFGQSSHETLQAVGSFVGDGYERGRAQPKQIETNICDGDLVVLYSDGVSEAKNQHGDLFEASGVVAVVSKERHRPPAEIAGEILKAAAAHSGLPSPADDQMAVVIQIGPEASVYRISAAPTLEEVSPNQFALLNAKDTASVCDERLHQILIERIPNCFSKERSKEVWNVLWESILNSINHGSTRGDVISLAFEISAESIEFHIMQPKEWRDWDRYLLGGDSDVDPECSGTVIIKKLASDIKVSRQGRRLSVTFKGIEEGR